LRASRRCRIRTARRCPRTRRATSVASPAPAPD
jgi:hypothetical protein